MLRLLLFLPCPTLLLLYYSLYLAAPSTPCSFLTPHLSQPFSFFFHALAFPCFFVLLPALSCFISASALILLLPARPFLLQQELPSPALPLPCYYLYLVAPACPAPTLDPVLVRSFSLPVPVPRRTSLHLLIPCFFLSLRSPPYS